LKNEKNWHLHTGGLVKSPIGADGLRKHKKTAAANERREKKAQKLKEAQNSK
jgi:hypothetical protein